MKASANLGGKSKDIKTSVDDIAKMNTCQSSKQTTRTNLRRLEFGADEGIAFNPMRNKNKLMSSVKTM